MNQNQRDYSEKRDYIRMRVDAEVTLIHQGQVIGPRFHRPAGLQEKSDIDLTGQSQKVVGVHIVGPESPEMIQLAAIAVKAGLTKAQWDATCAVHPTMAEELVTLKEKQSADTSAG